MLKVNIDDESNSELVAKYNVKSIPTLVVFKKGEKINQRVGSLPDSELEKLLQWFCKPFIFLNCKNNNNVECL